MRHSTVSAPIESCNVSNLSSPTLRYCALHLLHGQVLYFIVEPKSKTKELYNQACAHLAAQGMLDTDLFGLAVILDGEYLFVDPDYKLSKYAPKNWRSSSSHGLDNSGKPLLVFYFHVQFYVENPLLLRDETSRHHYYLQLRHNVVHRSLVYTYISEEIIYLLVGLALQADFGDYIESQHTDNYFSLQEYFPQQMVAHGNETRLFQNAVVVHKANRSLSKAQAETQFIREASSRDSFPLAHNSHLYRLKQKKHDPNPGTLLLAICTRGIELYEEKSNKPISGTFYWNNIGKLCFDRKKFEIRSLNPAGERMVYYTSSDEKSKHLLTLCRLTHQFCMAIQSRLSELTRKEEEEKNQYKDWNTELNVKLTDMCYNHNADQRISVISTTSSNTTSGIVSDRVHSLDESEDDLDMEIMINSPPAVSVESLALAHLRDSFKDSRKINKVSHNSSPVYHSTSKNQEENLELPCLSKLTLPTTPAPTDGSQCSSSCSTVVVTTYNREKIKSQAQDSTVLATNRRHSTSSSLELGFSHTAQNSALSDSASCLELDYSVQSAHTSSGIYTLQSSCETNTVATTAVAASSETSGICHSVVEDSEGVRSRSGSIVSASGSFHGDGSDPSDTGHGTPLTAEELSDLIVGRSPKPCRGKYPSVATVSESLDSVADYVTLPPPPIPPPRRVPFTEPPPLAYSLNTQNDTFSSRSSNSSGYMTKVDSQSSNRKYYNEEAMLQRQIQFQHLAAGYSAHLLMDALPNPVPPKIPYHSINGGASYPISNGKIQQSHKSCVSLPLRSEEASARIVSTKPQINMLKAQSSYVPSTALVPSYASPASFNYNVQTCRPQQVVPNCHPKFVDPSLHTPNQIPIVGNNNYLDVRRSGAAFLQQICEKFPPPPPLMYGRQPPPPLPPPPRNHYSLCNNILNHQFDQYKQQLYSDVDYVIYPMRDPAISKQEYLDSKEASGHCSQYLSQNSLTSKYSRPYTMYASSSNTLHGRKTHAMYRSTPNVAVASGGSYVPTTYCQHAVVGTRYSSNQNLSSELSGYSNSSLAYLSSKYPSSTSPLYSAAASVYSSSMQSLRLDSSIYGRILPSSSSCSFSRTRSDDNILNCNDKVKRLENNNLDMEFHKPPPPPPPPYNSQKHFVYTPERAKNLEVTPSKPKEPNSVASQQNDKNTSLDICSLREKSKNLDLPLISALCNDKSLLKQTNTIDAGKEQQIPWYNGAENKTKFSIPQQSSSNGEDQSNGIKSTSIHKSILESIKLNKARSSNASTSGIEIKKSDSVNITHKLGFSLSDTKIFDKSKFSICDNQAKSDKDASSCSSVKRTSSETVVVSSTARIKSISKQVNAKLTKSSTSTNKLKYPVSQPINKSVKAKSNGLNDNKDKVKFKASKIKSNNTNAQHSSTSNGSFKF